MLGCKDHARLALLVKKPGQEDRFKDERILAPKKGAWLVNSALAPVMVAKRNSASHKSVNEETTSRTGFKRNFEKSGHEEENSNYSLELGLAGEQNMFREGSFFISKGDGGLSLNKRAKSAGHNVPAPNP
jgi:hypothetical protein